MKYIITCLSLIVLCASCRKPIDFDLPESATNINLYGVLEVDSPIKVSVSATRSITAIGKLFDSLDDATIAIYENDVWIGNLTERLDVDDDHYYRNAFEKYYRINNNLIVKPNATYKIEVEHPNYPLAHATTSTPSNAGVQMKNLNKKIRIDSFGEYGYEKVYDLDFTLVNDSEEFNYYKLSMLLEFISYDTSEFNGEFYYYSDTFYQEHTVRNNTDLYFHDWEGNLIITPTLSSGNESNIILNERIYIDEGSFSYPEPTNLYLVVKQFNQSHYDYIYQLTKQFEGRYDPLSEPTIVYGNVSNGDGLFSSSSTTVIQFD